MFRLPEIALADSLAVDNPWDFCDDEGRSTLTLEIFSTDVEGWRSYATRSLARSSASHQLLQKQPRNRAQEEKFLKKFERQFVSRAEDSKEEDRNLAEHLFKIRRCNLFGQELPDSADNRLRLITRVPLPGGEAAQWGDETSPQQTCLPALWPEHLAERQGEVFMGAVSVLGEGEEEFRARWDKLREAGHVKSELVAVPYVQPGELFTPFSTLVRRWVLDVASQNGKRIQRADADASDFLAGQHDSGA